MKKIDASENRGEMQNDNISINNNYSVIEEKK